MNQPWIYMCSPSWFPLPPPSPPHPSGSSQCTWVLVSCIQPGLVICFTLDNIHVSMLFSQIIPPLPSPIESKRLFCTSVSLFLSCIWSILCVIETVYKSVFIIILIWLVFVLLFLVSDLKHLFSCTNTFSFLSYSLVLYFAQHILLLGYDYFMNWHAHFLFKK